jgi:hypothetical protein
MEDLFLMLVPLVFTNNLFMSVAKVLGGEAKTKKLLRGLLIAFSFIGVITFSALTGDPVDFDRISELTQMFAEVVVVAVYTNSS